jgi:hypothetical protein
MVTSFQGAVPTEFVPPQPEAQSDTQQSQPSTSGASEDELDARVKAYVLETKRLLRNRRLDKQMIWDECWQMYRGVEDWSDKDEWQSKIFVPKVWSAVKQATSVIKRLLSSATKPWQLEPVNKDDLRELLRAEQMTELAKVFMEKADYVEEFSEGLENGFIMGLGVWKVWWGMVERDQIVSQQAMGPQGPQNQIVRQTIQEGKLMVRAVDPYNFFWLPGSKLNYWTGTIEEIEVPRWELVQMAQKGVFDLEKVKELQPKKIDEAQKKEWLRFQERQSILTQDKTMGSVKLTEYYGPIVVDDEVIEEHGHVIIGNDNTLLKRGKNTAWHQKPPYIGFSPLNVPFRTDGVGVVEMVRSIQKSINKLANLSVDTLLFRLLPVFEVSPDVYENPEDFETGLTPGKIFRRNSIAVGQPGINPIAFEDISNGSVQVAAQLDRAHQEGSLISEIQQGIPRYRGVQTAAEIEIKQENQNSLFGGIASDIERNAIKPMVEMAMDLILQYVSTSNDPRVPSILGIDGAVMAGMTRAEIMEQIQGDYKVRVSGITDQLDKADMLQNLVQLMNILGQNPQAWMPYIRQDNLLKRILESFSPAIREIHDIVADPETVQMKVQLDMQNNVVTPELLKMLPQLIQMAQQGQIQQQQQQLAAQQQSHAQGMAERQADVGEISALSGAVGALRPPPPKGE